MGRAGNYKHKYFDRDKNTVFDIIILFEVTQSLAGILYIRAILRPLVCMGCCSSMPGDKVIPRAS